MDAVTEISQLLLGERQARDRGWWDRMRAAYAPDSTVRLSWFQGTGPDFVAASQQLAAALDPLYERDTVPPVSPGTPLTITPADVAGFRPAYRFLSYVLSQRGYQIATDLFGDDRPEELGSFYQQAFSWLGPAAS